jgi:uncharacterized membrane protein YfcA
MGGVSGAFLLLPFQMSILGYTAPSVSATNQVFNVIAIPSGVYRYIKEGRMLWPLTSAVIAGTLPGVFIGAWIRIEYLPNPKNFKFFAGLVLLYIGLRLAMDILKTRDSRKEAVGAPGSKSLGLLNVIRPRAGKVQFEFDNIIYTFSRPPIYALCFLVGVAGGIYGVGGGAIVAPFFVAIIGLPVYAVAGAALMGTFVTSLAGVFFFHLLAHFYPNLSIAPDWRLGLLLGCGGFLGMYLGAKTQIKVPARLIKVILCVSVVLVSTKYILGFIF